MRNKIPTYHKQIFNRAQFTETYLKLILFRILLLRTIHQVRVARTFLSEP